MRKHFPRDRILRRKQTREKTGVPPRQQIYLEKLGLFPLPRRIGIRAVGHSENELDEWIATRPVVEQDRGRG